LIDKQRVGWHALTLPKAYFFLNPSSRSQGLWWCGYVQEEGEIERKRKERKGHGNNRLQSAFTAH
jgi:hypothetical protein